MSVTSLDPNPHRCDRHGGRWGDDQACYTCVDEHGLARPTHDVSLCVYDPRPEFTEMASIEERHYAEEVLERIVVPGNQKES